MFLRRNSSLVIYNLGMFAYYTLILCLLFAATVNAAPDLSGYWVKDHGPVPGEIQFSEAGQLRKDNYDLLVDDPMLKCTPPSIGRVYSHPGTPFEIIQQENQIVFRYELFDLTRTVAVSYTHLTLPTTSRV